jgi:excisionase family DNA binding protein
MPNQNPIDPASEPRQVGKSPSTATRRDPVAVRAVTRIPLAPAYLRPEAAAAYTSISVRTLYRWVTDGRLKFRRIGGVRLVAVSDLNALLA